MCLNELCEAVLNTVIPKAVPLNIGPQGGVVGPSQMAQCLLILHPGTIQSISGSCGFSSPQFPHLPILPWNSGVPKPTAGASAHSSGGSLCSWSFAKSLIGTRLTSPFFPYNWSIGPVPSNLFIIEFDTEMPAERKECAGLAAPFPLCFASAGFGLTQPWGTVLLLMHFLPLKSSQPNRQQSEWSGGRGGGEG